MERVPITDRHDGDRPARRAGRAGGAHGRAGGRRSGRRAARHRSPQPDAGVTYAAKLDKAEGRLDWAQPAALLERQLRALNPWPGCWTEIDGQRVRVLDGEVVGRRRRARRAARRPADDRVRRGRAQADQGAARRRQADVGGRLSCAAFPCRSAPGSARHAPLQADPRIRRRAVSRLAAAERGRFGPAGAGRCGARLLRRERPGGRGRADRCRRARHRPGRASRSRARGQPRDPAQRPQLPSAAASGGGAGGGGCRDRFPRPLLGPDAALSLSDREPAGAAQPRSAPRLARAGAAGCRSHARGGAAPGRPARFHQLPQRALPGQVPGQDLGPADGQAASAITSRSRRAPARSCITRCATWSAPSSWSARAESRSRASRRCWRRAIARQPARPRPPAASIWSASTTECAHKSAIGADVDQGGDQQIDQQQHQRDAAGGLQRGPDHEPLVDQDGAGGQRDQQGAERRSGSTGRAARRRGTARSAAPPPS